MTQAPTTIDFLLLPDMLGVSPTLTSEMLVAAENAAVGRRLKSPRLRIRTVASSLDPILTPAGIPISPNTTLDQTPPGDFVFIPALWRNPKATLLNDPLIKNYILRAHELGSTIAAVGSGCFLLAATGLLNHKPATTHWHFFERFASDFPAVQLKRDYFITQAGNLYCAASINSLADLTVHFIQLLYDKSVAQHIQRHFSHEIRRAYESMRYFEGGSDQHSDETILQVQLWLQDQYHQAIQFADVARDFDMSVRSFNRRFKTATGLTPLKYLQELRMGTARDLLQTSNLTIGEIAYRVGYQDLGHFSALFKQYFAATPVDYRTTVRAKLFQLRA
jgi:transcriptional regulator GlxA family with amidase domain